ncbi:RuvC family protein [Nitrosopumilus sp. S4]
MKTLNLPFDSILPEEIFDYSGNLILTTKKESPKKCEKALLHEDIFENHPTVIKGLMMQKLNLDFLEEDLILGIDPGKRIGLSIFYYGKEIESIFHSSVENLVSHVIGVLGGLRAKRKIVKIGNGNMQIAKQISTMLNLKFCSSYELEFVDERKTSLKIKNFNQRGKRDMLSAKYISQRDGLRHSILPLSITG